MHANFVLCLLSSPKPSDSNHSTRTCVKSCGLCLRRFFRRFCFCLVLCIWSLSFTATIPLLYTIDSNEKTPKPVYCPGTTQISYLEEWFDQNRFVQSVIFNLIPLLATLFMSSIALLKLLYDCLFYMYLRLKMSKCCPCRKKSLHRGGREEQQHHHLYQEQRQQQQTLSIPNSISMLSSLGIINNSNSNPQGFHSIPMIESSTPTSETTIASSDVVVQSCGHWCSGSFLRFILVISCCLLACIYPIAMRFYLVYFSVLVPLIFAVLNFSLGQLTPTQTSTNLPTTVASNLIVTPSIPTDQQQQQQQQQQQPTTYMKSNITINQERLLRRNSPSKTSHHYSNDEFELQSPLMSNQSQDNDGTDERDEFLITPCSSSQSSAIQIHTDTVSHQHSRPVLSGKQKYFSNNLYEKCSRNISLR